MDGNIDVLLEWLETGVAEERELQIMALEQLCMLLLMSDNIDRCFETCPPRTFLPVLGRIFLDETAPENILEVTARAITYYLDVSNECTRRITQVDGALKAICKRLYSSNVKDRISKDLAEQCVKLLEHVCQREPQSVYNSGGLEAILDFITNCQNIHKDTLYSSMSLVTKLFTKIEPNDPDISKYSLELANLLKSEDEKIVESCLRCFSTLVDGFVRKQADPFEIVNSNNLVDSLLHLLCAEDDTASHDESVANYSFSEIYLDESSSFLWKKNTTNSQYNVHVSIIVPLLINLCKGSSIVTSQLINSPGLISSLNQILYSDEQHYGIKLAEILITLLTEGRRAMCKVALSKPTAASDSVSCPFNRTHRQLIDIIRQRDTDSLINLMETEDIDSNYVDDVGQTLLNWASAFGNSDMVIYLCEKGADPNKGSRSSSLHYAASFGRAENIKILLSYGADPDMRDEEGRTALDRAKERTDGEYQNVMKALTAVSSEFDSSLDDTEAANERASLTEKNIYNSVNKTDNNVDSDCEYDKNFSLGLVKQIVAAFCRTFKMNAPVSTRRSILVILKKAILYVSSTGNEDDSFNNYQFVDSLMEIVLFVLNNTDFESQEFVLEILKLLLQEKKTFWSDQIIKLGIHEKIDMLFSANVSQKKHIDSDILINLTLTTQQEKPSSTKGVKTIDGSADSWRIVAGNLYKWREWRIFRINDSTFIWSDTTALELCDESNGWLRFYIDGKVSTMYSSGTFESIESDCRTEFTTRFVEAKKNRSLNGGVKNIFSVPKRARKIEVGNWRFGSTEANSFCITNAEGIDQRLLLHGSKSGFVFESGKNKTTFTSNMLLGSEFEMSSTSCSSQKKVSKKTDHFSRINDLAREIFDLLAEAKTKPREPFIELQEYKTTIVDLISKRNSFSSDDYVKELEHVLRRLNEFILNERLLSSYEISKSSILDSLLKVVHIASTDPLTKKCLANAYSNPTDFQLLIRRIVHIIESNENLPKYLYDVAGGSSYGLQLLSRKIKFRLEIDPSNTSDFQPLLDKTNSLLKCEPLVSVGSLRSYLNFMLKKQWYDYPRAEINFFKKIKELKESNQTLKLNYESDFDTNGLIWYLGTNGRGNDWINPGLINVVLVQSSDGEKQPYGQADDIFSRSVTPLNCHTSDLIDSNFTIDLGVWIYPSYYTLRHAIGYGRSALRNWIFQASKDCILWECLKFHKDDKSLDEPGSTSSWPIDGDRGYIRIAQNGKNASCMTYYLSLSGFEIYGDVTDVSDDLKIIEIPKATVSTSGKIVSNAPSSSATSSIQTAFMSTKKQIKRNNVPSIVPNFHSKPHPSSHSSRLIQRHRKFDKFSLKSSHFPKASGDNKAKEISNSTAEHSTEIKVVNYNGDLDNEDKIKDSDARRDTSICIGAMDEMLTLSEILQDTAICNSPDVNKNRDMIENRHNINSVSLENDNHEEYLLNEAALIEPSYNDYIPTDDNLSVSEKFLQIISSEIFNDIPDDSISQLSKEENYDSRSINLRTNECESINAWDSNTEDSFSEKHLREGSSASESSESFEAATVSQEAVAKPISEDAGLEISSEVHNDKNLSESKNTNENTHPILNRCEKKSSKKKVCERSDIISSKVNLLSKLDNYAEAIRNVVQQIIQTGGDENVDENILENEIVDDVLLRHELRKQENDHKSRIYQSSTDNPNSVSSFPQLEPFTSAAAALRRQLSSKLRCNSGTGDVQLSSALKAMALGIRGNPKSDNHINFAAASQKNNSTRIRAWDNDYCMKRSFEYLIPSFDPRPGRQNIQEVELTDSLVASSAINNKKKTRQNQIRLFLKAKGDMYNVVRNIEEDDSNLLELLDDEASIFSCIQDLVLKLRAVTNNVAQNEVEIDQSQERVNVWDPTYTLVYVHSTSNQQEKNASIFNQQFHSTSNQQEKNASIFNQQLETPIKNDQLQSLLELIASFHLLSQDLVSSPTKDIFYSTKLTQKLAQELTDPVIVLSRALPKWCDILMYKYRCLFSLDARLMFLRATAFGDERSIIWLQNKRDQAINGRGRPIGSNSRQAVMGFQEDHYPEYRIGRIKHERIKVSRDETKILDCAIKLFRFHSTRKSILEIEYYDEEGTGLGPTLEFYTLVAAEFRRKAFKMWTCYDDEDMIGGEIDIGKGIKPAGYYVHSTGGLFPAYLPQDSEECQKVSSLFEVLGIFIAKLIQDDRIVDIPLSTSFLKIITSPKVSLEEGKIPSDLLSLDELEEVLPLEARFLKQLELFVKEKQSIISSDDYEASEKSKILSELKIVMSGYSSTIEDMSLSFVVNPPSSIFDFDHVNLIEDGENVSVTIHNVEHYFEKLKDFYLNTGIRNQIISFQKGFDQVFSLKTLTAFSPDELRVIISGDQCPHFTREDLMTYTEPKLGYTRESKGFLNLVEVLLNFSASERKAFLQFATGCSSLPPGGLANLHPRLTIVRKSGGGDGQYPSVNTCVHYLKLPEYSSVDALREKLIAATYEKGFHLN